MRLQKIYGLTPVCKSAMIEEGNINSATQQNSKYSYSSLSYSHLMSLFCIPINDYTAIGRRYNRTCSRKRRFDRREFESKQWSHHSFVEFDVKIEHCNVNTARGPMVCQYYSWDKIVPKIPVQLSTSFKTTTCVYNYKYIFCCRQYSIVSRRSCVLFLVSFVKGATPLCSNVVDFISLSNVIDYSLMKSSIRVWSTKQAIKSIEKSLQNHSTSERPSASSSKMADCLHTGLDVM